MTDNLLSGMDRLLAHPEKYLTGKTIGLIVNHTSLAGDGKHSIAHFKDQWFCLINI